MYAKAGPFPPPRRLPGGKKKQIALASKADLCHNRHTATAPQSCGRSPQSVYPICSGIEVVITSLTRNHVSTLEVQTAEKPVTMRVCGQVQIVNWGLFYPVVLPNFHGLNFAGKWL